MTPKEILTIFSVGVFVACLLWPLVLLYFDTIQAAGRFRLRTLVKGRRALTETEQRFFAKLKVALPGLDVHSQVAMGALLDVDLSRSHPQYWAVRGLFSRKIIDFVVYERNGRILAVVELDDRTHDGKKAADADRDGLLAQAGIPTVRFDCRNNVQVSDIQKALAPYRGHRRVSVTTPLADRKENSGRPETAY